MGAVWHSIHILAVRFQNDLRATLAPSPTLERPTCDRCGSGNVVQNGRWHNRSGALARYLCQTCGRRFTGHDGYQKRRANPEKIALVLDLYFRGLSLRKVADHFRQVYGLRVYPMTVYRWIAHYSALAGECMDAQGVRVEEQWHANETVVNMDGEPRYLWNVMDARTRFLLATHISRTRSLGNTRRPLQKAKQATADRLTEVLTDGMMAYPLAVSKELGKMGGPKGYTNPHRRVPSIRAPESNNRIERLHETEKERTKVVRAFDNEGGTAMITEGFRVHYNLVKPHMAFDGQTQGDAAGVSLTDGFRWKAILDAAITREVTVADESEGQVKSPD